MSKDKKIIQGYKKKISKEENKNKKSSNIKWIITITILAFVISFLFSFASETLMPNVPVTVGIIIIFIFIGFGILFDMIGVSVTSALEKPFHSMSAKKIRGANIAVFFKKNADKVSTFCNDVIGDICGIISGSAGVYIALKLSQTLNISGFVTSLLITAIIAALTIGGKAIGKSIAINKSTTILYEFSKFISYIYNFKNK